MEFVFLGILFLIPLVVNFTWNSTETVYHSNSMLSTLSSTWTSKPPLEIRYRLDPGTLQDSGGEKSHAGTLERLLAWEKKLYKDVKVFS